MIARSAAAALILLAAGCDRGLRAPGAGPQRPVREAAVRPEPEGPRSAIVPENCEGPFPYADRLEPVGEGPVRLAAVICGEPNHDGSSDAYLLSPDGRLVASLISPGDGTRLAITPVAGGAGTRLDTGVGSFLRLIVHHNSRPALVWSGDSRSVWTIRQQTQRRPGWALGPLEPIRVSLEGEVTALPPLRHAAGPLDGLLWAGGGKALALFGGRGRYYRPEHADPAPTLALVDAGGGRVLDTLPVHRFHRDTTLGIGVRNAEVVVLGDGRLRAFLDFDDWVVWTQGEPPLVLSDPYPDPRDSMKGIAFDGASILVARHLSADGICHRTGGCEPGPPVEGVLAARHDARTGRLIWTIRRRVTTMVSYPRPVIGPDSRYALIGVPSEARGRERLALISMRDGRIVQLLPALNVGAFNFGMGFLGPRRIWVRVNNVTAFYEFRAR